MATVERAPDGVGSTGIKTRDARQGLVMPRVFSTEGVSPFDQVDWDLRTAEIKDERGRVIFQQNDCEIPRSWSQLATNVVVSKYYYGEINTPERETSVRQLVNRVTRTIADWGREDGYFATADDAERFYDELTALCVNQYGSFNSPVWFNVGLYHQYGIPGAANNWRWDEETRTVVKATSAYQYPQASACFIQSVADDMQDIMRLATSEAMLFKYGSGTGTDLSTLRSSREKLAGGGKPSGPVSFMRVYDSIASVIKSGGKTRRAAKMQTLKVWHPDILEFIECKTKEEKKAQTLIECGYEANFNGEAYSSVMFQNANLSVRATDAFLRAAETDAEWTTRAVTTGRPMQTHRAKVLLDKIAEGTWLCGDPGMQYEDTIQRWHTCPNTAPINSSNPCSEYMFLDDSACNLASINLMKFRREDGTFDAKSFRAACRVFITAQEILVDHASYPTDRIAANSHKFRPLGLGYANLGSLIMASGLPYDSDEGRGLAGAVTAIMHGQAYLTSAEHAANVGPFDGFALNREPMLRVMEMHRDAVESIGSHAADDLVDEARAVWDACLEAGRAHGYRNSQVTVLAPTGTIAFMMDCDTTGVEPDIALVKYKSLAGGGVLKIVNRTVPMALRKLGYDEPAILGVLGYIDANDTIEGAPGLKDEHLPVFDCAFAPPQGGRSIHYQGHLRMMAAVQPFLSGAISKTVNMPSEATVADIRNAYLEGWKLGLKALAIYRDGSKGSQPVNTKSETDTANDKANAAAGNVGRADEASPRAATPPQAAGARGRGPGGRPGRVDGQPAPPRASASHPAEPDPQVRHPGSRRLRERRLLPRRPARRAVHHDGQGGFDDRRPDGRARHVDLDRSAIRRAAGGLRQQVRAQPVRAGRVHQEPGHPDRQEHRRLHLPLARHGVHPRLPRGQRPPAPRRGAVRPDHQDQRPPDRHDRRPGTRRGRAGHQAPACRRGSTPSRRRFRRGPRQAVRPLPERRPRLRQLRRLDRPLRHLLPLLQLREQHGLLVI